MSLNFTGHHIDITPTLRDYVQKKFKRLTRHFDELISTQVTLSVEHDTHQAEATLKVSGSQLHARAQHADMYAAIDAMTDKLDRQILKYKEKRKDHHQSQITHHQPN